MPKDSTVTVAQMVRGTGIPAENVEIYSCANGLECNATSVRATSDVSVRTVVDCSRLPADRCRISYEYTTERIC